MITCYVKSYDEALKLNAALVSVANENGFNKKTYDESGTFTRYNTIVVGGIYQAPNLPGHSTVSLDYRTDLKKSGGCFMVIIKLDDGNEFKIKLLGKQFEETMRKYLPSSTMIYRNSSYCGKNFNIRSVGILRPH